MTATTEPTRATAVELFYEEDKPCIRFHKKTFKSYHKIKDYKQLVCDLDIFDEIKELKKNRFGIDSDKLWEDAIANASFMDLVTVDVPKITNQQYYKILGDILGCSAKVALKHFNALMYKTYVGKYDNLHIRRFCINPTKKQIDYVQLNKLRRVAEKLDQVQKDGIYHIAPFVFYANKTPNELKDESKGTWKKLCKNSFTKNKHIATQLSMSVYVMGKKIDMLKQIDVARWNEIPSTLLRNHPTFTIDQLEWFRDHMKGSWGKTKIIKDFVNTLRDTERMAEHLGEPFSYKWSKDRVHAEHTRLTQLRNQRWRDEQASKQKDFNVEFSFVEEFTNKGLDKFELGEYTATLLKSPMDLQIEGDSMNHCVGSYANECKNNRYVVYSLSKTLTGEKYSTLGISNGATQMHFLNGVWANKDEAKKFFMNQHYMKYNRPIDDDNAKTISTEIIFQLNQKLTSKENTNASKANKE